MKMQKHKSVGTTVLIAKSFPDWEKVVARSGNGCLFRTIENNKINFYFKCCKTVSFNCYYHNPRQKTITLNKAKKIHFCPLGET